MAGAAEELSTIGATSNHGDLNRAGTDGALGRGGGYCSACVISSPLPLLFHHSSEVWKELHNGEKEGRVGMQAGMLAVRKRGV
jgi:hypothetical protein